MTRKDDPTISCTHFMVKLSVLAGRKIILKGVVTTPFSRRGLNMKLIKHLQDYETSQNSLSQKSENNP